MTEERILFLGPDDSQLLIWLRNRGEHVVQTSGPITIEFVQNTGSTFIVSYGYRHIISKAILDLFPGKAINLHISYLPWNRGADPNLWSFIDGTPKGVTIHFLDEGIDTGDIIMQREVDFDTKRETLATSYEKLLRLIEELFMQHWQNIREGRCSRRPQTGIGSIHRRKDRDSIADLLHNGWDTPVSYLVSGD